MHMNAVNIHKKKNGWNNLAKSWHGNVARAMKFMKRQKKHMIVVRNRVNEKWKNIT